MIVRHCLGLGQMPSPSIFAPLYAPYPTGAFPTVGAMPQVIGPQAVPFAVPAPPRQLRAEATCVDIGFLGPFPFLAGRVRVACPGATTREAREACCQRANPSLHTAD